MLKNTLMASLATVCLGAQLDASEPMELAQVTDPEAQLQELLSVGRGQLTNDVSTFNVLNMGDGWVMIMDARVDGWDCHAKSENNWFNEGKTLKDMMWPVE